MHICMALPLLRRAYIVLCTRRWGRYRYTHTRAAFFVALGFRAFCRGGSTREAKEKKKKLSIMHRYGPVGGRGVSPFFPVFVCCNTACAMPFSRRPRRCVLRPSGDNVYGDYKWSPSSEREFYSRFDFLTRICALRLVKNGTEGIQGQVSLYAGSGRM